MTQLAVSPWTGSVHRSVLPNGLTILVAPDPLAPGVAIVTHVRAGFFDEPDRWVGISHVLEHMFFKGTATLPPGEVARATKSAGGYLNAHTSYDHTAYFVVVPPAQFERALAIQCEAYRHAALAPDELARELQVIIEEAKRKLDSAGAVAQETLHEVLFDSHRIRRWRIGTAEQLERYRAEDVRAYYESRYTPAATIVSIAGQVDAESVVKAVQGHYDDWAPAMRDIEAPPEERSAIGVRARTLRGDVEMSDLVLGWRGVPPTDDDAILLDLAAGVLAAGRGSWLYQSLRESGIATGVGAYHYGAGDVGVFAIGAEVAPERLSPALAEIAAGLARLRDDGPTAPELDRARALLQERFARRMETMEGRALTLASAEALAGIDFIDRQHELLERATIDSVRAAAVRHLRTEAMGAVVFHPADRGEDLSDEEVRVTFAAALPSRPLAPSGKGGHAEHPLSPRLPSGRPVQLLPTHLALPGADLIVQHRPGVPHVALGCYWPRTEFDAPEQAGLGALAMRSAVRGGAGMTALELAVAFERLGGVLSPTVSADLSGFSITVGAAGFEPAGRLLEYLIREPAFEDDEVSAELALLREDSAQLRDDMYRQPMQLAFGARFGDAAYGLPPLGTPATLANLGAHAAGQWYRAMTAAGRPLVVAVGDLDPDQALGWMSTLFGGWPSREATPDVFSRSPLPLGDGSRVELRDKQQTALAMVFAGPRRNDSDRYAAEVWAGIASGLGGRLFERLRDERSLAYTVQASSVQHRRAGAFVTYIATSPAREDEARDQMLAELRRFGTEGVTREELERASSYLAGLARLRRQTAAAVAGEIVEVWLLGEGLHELENPGAPYHLVTADAVQRVAADAFVHGSHSEGVVRGEGVPRE